MDIAVPKAGLTMASATIGMWLVKEGDRVRKGQTVLELTTEKITVEVEAPADGTIERIMNQEGEEVPVGAVVARLAASGGAETALSSEPVDTGQAFPSAADVDVDVTVIGGGPGGYAAAIRSAQLGGKVVLVEEHQLGGTCLNAGCIPTKMFLQAAQTMETVRRAAAYGIHYAEPRIDYARLNDFKHSVISQLRQGIEALFQQYGIRWVQGRAAVINPHTVQVWTSEGEERIGTKQLILAAGGKPIMPPIQGIEEASPASSEQLLEELTPIHRLAIIGSGAIGVEFATLYALLGTKVILLEREERILPRMDAECSRALSRSLTKQGVDVYTGAEVHALSNGTEKRLRCVVGEETLEFAVDEILVASGWRSNAGTFRELGLEASGRGIRVNTRMETSSAGVYAVGDITGIDNLAHVAAEQGVVAAENCMGLNREMDYSAVPRCVYTSPEIASVGLTEEEAKAQGLEFDVGKVSFQANGMALAKQEAEGFAKVLIGKKYREIIGVHLIGPHASELISQAVIAMKLESTAEEFAHAILPHPTLSEIVGEAVRKGLGISVNS